jgi:hypothetical protein
MANNGPIPGIDSVGITEYKRILSSTATVIDALAPDAAYPDGFPYPKLLQFYDPLNGPFTHEGPKINGEVMPGQWLLTDCTVQSGFQIKEGAYLSGAVLVPSGDPLTKIGYDIRIWASNDAASYRGLLGTLLKNGVTSVPGTTAANSTNLATAILGIDDPPLKDVGITQVVVWSRTPLFNPLAKGGGKGPWTARVEFMQWRKPVPAKPIPDQAAPDPGPLTPSAYQNAQTAAAKMAADRAAIQAALAQGMGL